MGFRMVRADAVLKEVLRGHACIFDRLRRGGKE